MGIKCGKGRDISLRERMQEETDGIKEHEGCYGNLVQQNFLKRMKRILMGDRGVPTGQLLSSNKSSSTRNRLHLIELLAKNNLIGCLLEILKQPSFC